MKVEKGVYYNDWHDSINNFRLIQNELIQNVSVVISCSEVQKMVIPYTFSQRVLEVAHGGHSGMEWNQEWNEVSSRTKV